jgi:hypothetical protein
MCKREHELFQQWQRGIMTTSKMCKHIADIEAENTALAAELAEAANEPPTLEQIAEFMDEIGILKQQIERMKCCANCEHSNGRGTCVGLSLEEWRECFNECYSKWRPRE